MFNFFISLLSFVILLTQSIAPVYAGALETVSDSKNLVQMSSFDPNDVYYPEQWYLRQIGMPLAWEETTGLPDVVVAVIDSGVDVNHPDLKENIWRNPGEIENDGVDNDKNGYVDDVKGWDFLENTNDPRPDATPPYSRTALNHGTLISGIIAARGNNINGSAGISWHAKIMPIRVLDNKSGQGSVDAVVEAVYYAINNGAKIINLSFVGIGYSQRLYEALNAARLADIVIVAAAGNVNESVGGTGDIDENFLFPICYDAAEVNNKTDWILGVTATDTLDQRALFANYGSRCVDLSAPGLSIFGTQVYDESRDLIEAYGGGWSGTSLAAPIASGVAALIRAVYPKLTNTQVIEVLMNSADSLDAGNRDYAGKLGSGRINATRALEAAASPSALPSKEPTNVGGRVISLPGIGIATELKVLSAEGAKKASWFPFGEKFRGGGSVAVAESTRVASNPNIRGEQWLVVGEGVGGQGRVVLTDQNGQVQTSWLGFNKGFRGGIQVAADDVWGKDEGLVVVMPLSGGGPQVRIFDRGGRLRGQFFAYDKNLRGGFSLAVADVTGDGRVEIITASTTLSLPVRIFEPSGELLAEWWPYPNYRGGVNVAAGDLNANGIAEILVVPRGVGGPQVRIFNVSGRALGQFFVFDKSFRGGTNLAVGDLDSDGRDEIIVAPASQGGPQIKIFSSGGALLGQFFAYETRFRGGVKVAVLR